MKSVFFFLNTESPPPRPHLIAAPAKGTDGLARKRHHVQVCTAAGGKLHDCPMTSETRLPWSPPGRPAAGLTQTEQQRGDADPGGEARFHPGPGGAGALCWAAGGAAGRELTSRAGGAGWAGWGWSARWRNPRATSLPRSRTPVCPAVELPCPTTRLL